MEIMIFSKITLIMINLIKGDNIKKLIFNPKTFNYLFILFIIFCCVALNLINEERSLFYLFKGKFF